ncbi:WecB/TagA/CpsF family glycosyltransferase [Peribacillus sp. NJ4]|nr:MULTISPECIES: WecB/TagA/CpsF family glycosyltransferase [unclassified Peribacillus]MDM5215027.1 WecB/TagA/CpsF family glycosyltransferase [Peribacillus sp. NJ4]MDM5224289.1 WecB/TagA/CpsF family glycosyltransferase [Peribacillus sp. NJ11]
MSVSVALDFLLAQKRVPVWMQKFGLEWLYRFLQEP